MLVVALAVMLSATLFTSCKKVTGSGETVTENRSAGTFSGISLAMSATVHYSQSNAYSITITGQENIIREIETHTVGSTLVIEVRDHVILGPHSPVTVYVTAPSLSALGISGSGTIFAEGVLDPASLNLTVSGSGSIRADSLHPSTLTATISGSGDIKALSGSTSSESLKISGSGEIDLRSVACPSVVTTTSGSGDTYVRADNQLDVTISGSGNVWYAGTPSVNTHISGSGNVKKL